MRFFALRCLILIAAFTSSALAQGLSSGGAFAVDGHAIAGAGISSGGAYSLIGVIGGRATTTAGGGSYAVTGGPAEIFVFPLGPMELEISLEGNFVRVVWPGASGAVLESTSNLNVGSIWQPVSPPPAQSSHTVFPSQPAQFFRLRR